MPTFILLNTYFLNLSLLSGLTTYIYIFVYHFYSVIRNKKYIYNVRQVTVYNIFINDFTFNIIKNKVRILKCRTIYNLTLGIL